MSSHALPVIEPRSRRQPRSGAALHMSADLAQFTSSLPKLRSSISVEPRESALGASTRLRTRSQLPDGRGEAIENSGVESPVPAAEALNTKLLHQRSQETFYRDGRGRRHSGASTSSHSTRRCVCAIALETPPFLHARLKSRGISMHVSWFTG